MIINQLRTKKKTTRTHATSKGDKCKG